VSIFLGKNSIKIQINIISKKVILIDISHNGTDCTVKRDGRTGGMQIMTFIEKLMSLIYELLIAYFDRDIQFLSSTLTECRNMIIYEIFISAFNIIIRFVRKYVFKLEMSFIDTI